MNVGNNNPNNNANNNQGQRYAGNIPVVSPNSNSPRTPVGQHQVQPQQDPNAQAVSVEQHNNQAGVQFVEVANAMPANILIPAQPNDDNQPRGVVRPRELFPDNNNNNQ